MKNIRNLLLASLTMAIVTSLPAATIVTVSMQKLFDGYYKSAEASERIDSVRQQAMEEAQTKEQDLQAVATEVQGMQEELQNPMLSDDAKAEKEQEIRTIIDEARQKQAQYQQWQQQTTAEIQRRSAQVRAGLIEEIVKVVNDIALKDYSADLVFDTSDIIGSGVPTVLYADSDLDITDKVLQELNKKAPADSE